MILLNNNRKEQSLDRKRKQSYRFGINRILKDPVEFLKWNNPPSISGTVHNHS